MNGAYRQVERGQENVKGGIGQYGGGYGTLSRKGGVPVSLILILLLIVLVVAAVGGGVFVHNLLWLILVAALIVLLVGLLTGRTAA